MKLGRKALTVAQQYVNLRGNPVSAGAGNLRARPLHMALRGIAVAPEPRLRRAYRDGSGAVAGGVRRDARSRCFGGRSQASSCLSAEAAAPLPVSSRHVRVSAVDEDRPDDRAVERRFGFFTSRTGSAPTSGRAAASTRRTTIGDDGAASSRTTAADPDRKGL